MIYVEEKDLESQFKLLEYISTLTGFTVVGWQYPEIRNSPIGIFPSQSDRSNFEPVTNYSSGEIPIHTKPMKAKASKFAYVAKFKDELRKSFDSFCLYKNGSCEWYACTIGHEGMCLVRDESLLSALKSKGFRASLEKPEWW